MEKQEADLVRDYEKLEFVCKIKDLEILQEKKIVEKFRTENEELKKVQGEKTQQVNRLKSEVDELKTEKEKLKLENTEARKTENETKKEIKEKTENRDERKRKSLLMAGFFAQMNNRVKEAINIFSEALTMETDNEETALLHVLRAEANAATEKPPNMDIVLDYSKAIEKGIEGWKAFMLRGRLLVKLGIFHVALRDFETVKIKKSENFLKIIEDTKALQKQWEDKGH
ncbi:MAP7 domain-containing protein 2-like [Palaemon carinicauda]|uniref:MAP7 domain-containing protein 2-like n=1 Tax=Palaemon carinicauda TaxID=392227 RepID=UPI0035B5E162